MAELRALAAAPGSAGSATNATDRPAAAVFMTGSGTADARTIAEELNARVILDLVCLRSVAGAEWALERVRACQGCVRYCELIPKAERFRFGDGGLRTSSYLLRFEASFLGHLAVLSFSVIDGACPPLFSRQ
eukprot:11198106-Lingulodinium_polyedra.AAC.1